MVDLDNMKREQIQAWVIDLLAEMFELDKSELTADSNLYADLDIDSIDAVDLAVKLKQLTGKRMQPEVFKTIRTIGDVVNALEQLSDAEPVRHAFGHAGGDASVQARLVETRRDLVFRRRAGGKREKNGGEKGETHPRTPA